MDPNVGGDTNVKFVTLNKNNLHIKDMPDSNKPKDARGKMEVVLQNISKEIEELVGKD